MRLQAITLSLLAATGLATPIRRDVSQAVYTLRLTSPVKSLDGLYLTTTPQSDTDDTSTLGVSTSTTPSPATQPVRFYPVHNPDTDLDELRRSSDTGGGGGALAVVGANGLLDFAALADPEAVQAPDGTTVDWTSFRLGAEKKEGVVVRLMSAWTTENYMPVEVVYELVKEE